MSIIQSIRDKASWLVVTVIALSLLGFILMDARSGSSRLFGGQSTTVGVVDGKKIEYLDYQERIKQQEDQYTSQGYPMNDFIRQNIQDQVWNQYIMDEVMEK